MDINEDKAENTPAGGVLVGKKDGQTIIHDKGTMSGYLVGKLHKDGGIKAVNKATGQPLEMQGGEVIITAPAVSDQTKREFEGKMMTNREILSAINEKGGGVSFANGGDIPAKINTTDCEYKFGGKVVKDTDIAHSLGMKSTLKKGKQHFSSGDTTYDVDAIYNAIKKGKLRLKTKEVETFPMKYPVYDKNYAENHKIDFRKPNGITVLTESGEEVLIDGNHRMNNAYSKGRKTMKTYYIEDPKQIAKFTKKNKFELGGENKVGGHLSSGKSLKQIAEMHNVSLAEINKELEKGLEVEKEHFADFKERTRVAKDHLVENPNYYTILEKAGLKYGGRFDNGGSISKENKIAFDNKSDILKSFYKTNNASIDNLLIECQPFINELIEQQKKLVLKLTLNTIGVETPMSESEIERYEIGLIFKMVQSFNKYLKTTDVLTDVTIRNVGLFEISASVIRDGKKYSFRTELIPAGGYNVQEFHYRYITKTDLPESKENSAIDNLKSKLSVFKKIKSVEDDINRKIKSISDLEKYIKQGYFGDDNDDELYRVNLSKEAILYEQETIERYKKEIEKLKIKQNDLESVLISLDKLKDGGHLIHHRHSNNLVKDAKSGNTPARDLNNYNDVMDLEADGMVGMESGLAFAKGGLVTKGNLKNIEKEFLSFTDNSHYKGIYDEDEIDYGVALEWGKYGYSVSEDQQEEDYKMLKDASAKFNTKNIGKLYASTEFGDKFNTVTIFDYDMLANDGELVSRLPEKYFAKLKVGRGNNRYIAERIKEESDKIKELEAVGVISKKLGVSEEKADNILFSLKYDKEYYEKNKNQSKPRFDVFNSRNFPSKKFENLEETLNYIQSDAFANSVYMSTGYGNPISEGIVHLYGWGALDIKYKQDDFPFRPDGSTDFYKDRTTTLKIHPYLAVNVGGKQDFMTSFKKGISDFVWCYNYYVLGANDKKNLDDIDNLSDLLKFVETGSYAKGGEVKDVEPYFEIFSINGLSGVDYVMKSQVKFMDFQRYLDSAERGIEKKYEDFEKFPFHDFVKKYDYVTKNDFRYSNQEHKEEIDTLVEKLKKDGYTVLTKTYSFTKGTENKNNRAINVFAFKLKSFADGGITPIDANIEGDSVDVVESDFAKGGVVYDTTKPKLEKVTIKETRFNRASVIGRNASNANELQDIIIDYVRNSPEEIDWIKFYVNDATRGSYYIDLNKGKKNTVKNVNTETVNPQNIKRVIDAKDYLVKNYDWTDFFEGASKGLGIDPNAIAQLQSLGVNVNQLLAPKTKIPVILNNSVQQLVETPTGQEIPVIVLPVNKDFDGKYSQQIYIRDWRGSDWLVNTFANIKEQICLTKVIAGKIANGIFEVSTNIPAITLIEEKVTKRYQRKIVFYQGLEALSKMKDIISKDLPIPNLVQSQVTAPTNSAKTPMTKEELFNSRIWIGDNVELRDKVIAKLEEIGIPFDKYSGNADASESIDINIFGTDFVVYKESKEEFDKDTMRKEIFLSDLGIDVTTMGVAPKTANASTSAKPFDFSMTKIDVMDNVDLSARIQKKAFEDGWEWENGGGKNTKNFPFNYMYFTKTSISYGNTNSSFSNSPKREITEAEIFGIKSPTKNKPVVESVMIGWKETGLSLEEKILKTPEELFNLLKEAYGLKLEFINIQPLGSNFVVGSSIITDRLKEIVLNNSFEDAEAEFMSELEFGNFPELDFSEFIRNSTSQAPAPDKQVTEISVGYVNDSTGNSGTKRKYSIKQLYDFLKILYTDYDKFSMVSILPMGKNFYGADLIYIGLYDNFWKNIFDNLSEDDAKDAISKFLSRSYPELNFDDYSGLKKMSSTVINQGSNLAPYEASQVTLTWINYFGTQQTSYFYTDDGIGGSGQSFISALKGIEKNSRGKDVDVTIGAYSKDNDGKEIERFTEFNIGENWFQPSKRTNEEIKSIVENDWIDGITFEKFFEDVIPLGGGKTIVEKVYIYDGSSFSDIEKLMYYIDSISNVERDVYFYINQNRSKDWIRLDFTDSSNPVYLNPNASHSEKVKRLQKIIEYFYFDYDWSDFFEEEPKQTPTVSGASGSVEEIDDLKKAVGVLEGIASQASKKYNTNKYDDNLQLLKEVKEEYELALSFTPESSFMYERIELMKKITEVQKEITRITELKNGGAFYILSKVIERLDKGEDWKQLGNGEIMVNEVPPQEIDAVIYTEKFKNWFGDWEKALVTKEYDYVSKALTENGKPCVMYHGAKRIKYSYRQVSNGVLYLAEKRSYAEWFSATDSPYQKQGDYLTQCFVNIKNSIDLTPFGVEEVDLRDIIQYIDALYPLAKIYDVLPPNTAMAIMNNQLIGRNFRAWYIIRQFPELNKHIRDNTTYDGFIYYENNPSDMILNESGEMVENVTKATAVFKSNQVKLVDAMLFDVSLDDWRFEKGGKVN